MHLALGSGEQSMHCSQELETRKALADERGFLTACGTGLIAVSGCIALGILGCQLRVGSRCRIALLCFCVVGRAVFAPPRSALALVLDGGG